MSPAIRPLAAAILLLGLAGCGSQLVPWTPVASETDAGDDRVVSRNDVVVRVENFGVLDGWGNPTGELGVFNGGTEPVTCDLAAIRLDADGDLFPPTLDAGSPTTVTLQPGESFARRLVFEASLPIQPRYDTDRSNMQVLTRELHLHLPPLIIDGAEIALPVFVYRNPDPMET
jgi:hypothetical protein